MPKRSLQQLSFCFYYSVLLLLLQCYVVPLAHGQELQQEQAEAEAVAVAAGAGEAVAFALPSFSMIAQLDEQIPITSTNGSDDDGDDNLEETIMLDFQDRLEIAVRQHLIDFFTNKLSTTIGAGSGSELDEDASRTVVKDVALSTHIFWNELKVDDSDTDSTAVAPSSPSSSTATATATTTRRHYEVRSSFNNCQIELLDSSDDTDGEVLAKRIFTNQSVLDLLMIEAFQGNNYWHLFHLFLSDIHLSNIDNVDISVMTTTTSTGHGSLEGSFHGTVGGGQNRDGATPPSSGSNSNSNGRDPASPTATTTGSWTMSMKIGISFASFFLLVLVILWTYLLLFVRGTCLFKVRGMNAGCSNSGKDEGQSVTDPENISDLDYDDIIPPHHEQQLYHSGNNINNDDTWMDEWAIQITSIPVRQPYKQKKKVKRSKHVVVIRRPSQQHISQLCQISESEADDDLETGEEYNDDSNNNSCSVELGGGEGEGRQKEAIVNGMTYVLDHDDDDDEEMMMEEIILTPSSGSPYPPPSSNSTERSGVGVGGGGGGPNIGTTMNMAQTTYPCQYQHGGIGGGGGEECTTLVVYQSRDIIEHPDGTTSTGRRYEYRVTV